MPAPIAIVLTTSWTKDSVNSVLVLLQVVRSARILILVASAYKMTTIPMGESV